MSAVTANEEYEMDNLDVGGISDKECLLRAVRICAKWAEEAVMFVVVIAVTLVMGTALTETLGLVWALE